MFGESRKGKDPDHHIANVLEHHYFLYFSIKEAIRVEFATGCREDDSGGLQMQLSDFFIFPTPIELELPVVHMDALAAIAGYPELIKFSLREDKPDIQVHQKFLPDPHLILLVYTDPCLAPTLSLIPPHVLQIL